MPARARAGSLSKLKVRKNVSGTVLGDRRQPSVAYSLYSKYPEAAELTRSSDLAAVATLWIADLLQTREVDPLFEFAAARLTATHPWLASGADNLLEASNACRSSSMP